MINVFAFGYAPKIAKKDLVDGEYYKGYSKYATIARWSAAKQRFLYWRKRFGLKYREEICHPIDDFTYDVFVVECVCEKECEIPLD